MKGRTACLGLATLLIGAAGLSACDSLQPQGPAATYAAPAGYAPPPPMPPPAAVGGFDPNAFAWSQGTGPGAVAGRVAYHAAAGERWTCSTQTIALIPATRYSAERMVALYGSRDQAVVPAAEVRARNAQSPGVDYGRYVRTARCDSHDAFSFAGLQPGPYFLIARARPRGHAAGPDEGVVLMRRVQVDPGLTRLSVPGG